MGDSDCGALRASARAKAMELVFEVAALLVGRGQGRFDQGCPQMHVPRAGASGLLFAGTLVVPWAHACPRREMLGAGEDAHVGPVFGDEDGGHDAIHAGNLLEQAAGLVVRPQSGIDAGVEQGEVGVDEFEPVELQTQEKAMMVLQPALQSLLEVRRLFTLESFRQLRHRLWGRLAVDERAQHQHSGDSEHIAHDAGELDIRGLQELSTGGSAPPSDPRQACAGSAAGPAVDAAAWAAQSSGRSVRAGRGRPAIHCL